MRTINAGQIRDRETRTEPDMHSTYVRAETPVLGNYQLYVSTAQVYWLQVGKRVHSYIQN